MTFPYEHDPDATIEELRDEVELLRMQLVACSMAAQCNTHESMAKHRIPKGHPYWTSAYWDVCGAVNREVENRDAYVKLRERHDKMLREFTGG